VPYSTTQALLDDIFNVDVEKFLITWQRYIQHQNFEHSTL
jgi:hypothetical protein